MRYYDIAKSGSARQPAKEDDFDLVGATRWLKGEQHRIASETGGKMGVQNARHYITPAIAAELTTSFLSLVASKAKTFFEEGMPKGYPLQPSKPTYGLVDKYPHLGWCAFASVASRKADGTPFVVRLHYANFNARLDTTPGQKFFTLNSPEIGEMFFGVAFVNDGTDGSSVVIDRSLFHSGVTFVTDSAHKALDNTVRLRTGVSAEEWRKMARAKLAEQQSKTKAAA